MRTLKSYRVFDRSTGAFKGVIQSTIEDEVLYEAAKEVGLVLSETSVFQFGTTDRGPAELAFVKKVLSDQFN